MENEKENRLEQKLEKYFELMMGELQNLKEHTATKEEVREIVNESEKRLEQKIDDNFLGVRNRMSAIDNRIDNETFARRDLEIRVRSVVPNLPLAPERV